MVLVLLDTSTLEVPGVSGGGEGQGMRVAKPTLKPEIL